MELVEAKLSRFKIWDIQTKRKEHLLIICEVLWPALRKGSLLCLAKGQTSQKMESLLIDWMSGTTLCRNCILSKYGCPNRQCHSCVPVKLLTDATILLTEWEEELFDWVNLDFRIGDSRM